MLPDYLKRDEKARFFPVLSTPSKEGRATSIFLGCLCNVREFGDVLLQSVGHKTYKRSIFEAFTEVSFQDALDKDTLRPDGLIVVKTGASSN